VKIFENKIGMHVFFIFRKGSSLKADSASKCTEINLRKKTPGYKVHNFIWW